MVPFYWLRVITGVCIIGSAGVPLLRRRLGLFLCSNRNNSTVYFAHSDEALRIPKEGKMAKDETHLVPLLVLFLFNKGGIVKKCDFPF